VAALMMMLLVCPDLSACHTEPCVSWIHMGSVQAAELLLEACSIEQCKHATQGIIPAQWQAGWRGRQLGHICELRLLFLDDVLQGIAQPHCQGNCGVREHLEQCANERY
jgi:hypothetical protein